LSAKKHERGGKKKEREHVREAEKGKGGRGACGQVPGYKYGVMNHRMIDLLILFSELKHLP